MHRMESQMNNNELAPLKTGFKVDDVVLKIAQTYNGEPDVKKVGVQIPYTEEQIQEFIKCKNDPIYFIENYLTIIHVDKGIVPFKLYDYQKKLVNLYKNNRFSIALQARQSGKTQTTAAFILWYALFHNAKNIAVLANKLDQAIEIQTRITEMYKGLPFFLQQGCSELNKKSIVFENSSKIFCAATSPSAIRGKSISLLYMDEAAFIPNDTEFFESVMPTISSGSTTKIILSSTPKGARGMFYKIYMDSKNGDNKYKYQKVIWSEVPNRDEEWRQTALADLGNNQTRFEQEYECSFVSSVGSLIESRILETMVYTHPVIVKENLNILSVVDPTHLYVAIADSSMGTGGDYSVTTVIDVTEIPYKQVAVYRCNTVAPLIYPYHIVELCNYYNKCPLLIETNNESGGQVSYITAYDLEYEGVIWTCPDKRGRGMRIGGGSNARAGVNTSKAVKAIGCGNLKTLIENQKLLINDMDTLDELGTFVAKGASYEADDGCHDDTVMPLVLFSWLVKQEWFVEYTSSDIQTNVYDSMVKETQTDLLPVMMQHETTETPPLYSNCGFKITEGHEMSFSQWMSQ